MGLSREAIEKRLKEGNYSDALNQFYENTGQQDKIKEVEAEYYREQIKTGDPSAFTYYPLQKIQENPYISEEKIQEGAKLAFIKLLEDNRPWKALNVAYKTSLDIDYLQRAAEAEVRYLISEGPSHDQSSAIAVIQEGWVTDEKLVSEFMQHAFEVYLSSRTRYTDILSLVSTFPQYFNEDQKEIAKAVGTHRRPLIARKGWQEED